MENQNETLTDSSPEKSLSSVRNSIQWHSCLSLIGTQGLYMIWNENEKY